MPVKRPNPGDLEPIETASRDEITALQVQRLRETLRNAYDNVPHYRRAFDQKGVVRHQIVNDLPLGRSIEEALRMVDALQFFEKNGEVCPANWKMGKEGMKANAAGVASYLAKNAKGL